MRSYYLISLVALACATRISAADFKAEVGQAQEGINTTVRGIDMRAIGFDLIEANAVLMKQYPASSRTPVQSFVLGNMLYCIDPTLSFTLHQEAAAKLGDVPEVSLEWAMELHRRGAYAEAAAAYQKYLAANADFAPVHGLLADCHIRLGHIAEACTSWEASERSRRGSLEQFESFLCDIRKDVGGAGRRHELRATALRGDRQAVVRLLTGDADVEHDWWNRGPSVHQLAFDAPLLDHFAGDASLDLMRCLVAMLQVKSDDLDAQRKILAKYPRVLDAIDQVSEGMWKAYGILFQTCLDRGLRRQEDFGAAYLASLVARSAQVPDPELFNLIASQMLGRPTYRAWVRKAWTATHDVRFAIGCLLEDAKATDGMDTEVLQEALVLFPQDANLQARAIERKGAAVVRDDLTAAIAAEYTKLSISSVGVDFPRPRASRLRLYFTQLSRLAQPAPK